MGVSALVSVRLPFRPSRPPDALSSSPMPFLGVIGVRVRDVVAQGQAARHARRRRPRDGRTVKLAGRQRQIVVESNETERNERRRGATGWMWASACLKPGAKRERPRRHPEGLFIRSSPLGPAPRPSRPRSCSCAAARSISLADCSSHVTPLSSPVSRATPYTYTPLGLVRPAVSRLASFVRHRGTRKNLESLRIN